MKTDKYNDYIVSNQILTDDELVEMGLGEIIKVPDPKNFGLKEDTVELEGVSDFDNYPFFSMDMESDGTPGFYESSSFDPEDYDSFMDPLS